MIIQKTSNSLTCHGTCPVFQKVQFKVNASSPKPTPSVVEPVQCWHGSSSCGRLRLRIINLFLNYTNYTNLNKKSNIKKSKIKLLKFFLSICVKIVQIWLKFKELSQLCHTNRTPKSHSNSPELFNRLRPAPQHCPPQQWVVWSPTWSQRPFSRCWCRSLFRCPPPGCCGCPAAPAPVRPRYTPTCRTRCRTLTHREQTSRETR